MGNIEINTSQNVTIEYELAPLRDRIIAYILDFLIILGSILLLFFLGMFLFRTGSFIDTYAFYYWYLVGMPIFFFYNLVSEIVGNGATLGKKVMKIKVVKLQGKEPKINDFITRWAFRAIDIYFSLGSIASILISSSNKNQRLGDMLANTAVIKYQATYMINLKDLLNRTSIQNYQPVYTEATRFNDEEMLLVKSTIERFQKYPNQAHREAVDSLVEKISMQIHLSQKPKNKIEFLKTLLKDYVILTR